MSVQFKDLPAERSSSVRSTPGPGQLSFSQLDAVKLLAGNGTADEEAVGTPTVQAAPRNIFEAAERGVVGFIVRQVERNIEYDINQRDKYQRTALHWAAEMGQLEVVETLLDYGCNPIASECNGRTAIHYAAREGHADILKTLMENFEDAKKEFLVNQPDNHGITPVFLSLQKGEDSRQAFEYLMLCGGKYNAQHTPKFSAEEPPPVIDQPKAEELYSDL